MQGEIITIGNELLSGRTLDLNAWYAAGRLTASGLYVSRITSVGDDLHVGCVALSAAVAASSFVIVTGGLGSTEDDMTNEMVAKTLHRPLCLDKQMFELIRSHADERGIEVTASLEKMAWMPDGARLLNPEGTTCGFLLMENGVRLYFLPGVPDQMRYLMDKFVIPDLLRLCKILPVMRQRILKLYGLNEPRIAEIFKELHGKTGEVSFGFYPHFPENHITISMRGEDESAVTQKLNEVEKEIRALVGPHLFAAENDTMAGVVGRGLMKRKWRLSVAESCTGGLIGHWLTNVPGSSNYFQGGVAVYSNQSKIDLLKVRPDTISRHGAVSNQTAKEMAMGVKSLFNADLGLSVTGIAGPEGGTKEKPVGTVHVGLTTGEDALSGKYRFWGTRQQVKTNAAMMALDWVRRYLDGDAFLSGI